MSYNFDELFAQATDLQSRKEAGLTAARDNLEAYLEGMVARGFVMRFRWSNLYSLINDEHNRYCKDDQRAHGRHVTIDFFNYTSGCSDLSRIPATAIITLSLSQIVENPDNPTIHPVELRLDASRDGWFKGIGGFTDRTNIKFSDVSGASFDNDRYLQGNPFTLEAGALGDDFERAFGGMIIQAHQAGCVQYLEGENLAAFQKARFNPPLVEPTPVHA